MAVLTIEVTGSVTTVGLRVKVAAVVVVVKVVTVVAVVDVATVVVKVDVAPVAVTVTVGNGKFEVQKAEAGAKPVNGEAIRAGSPPLHSVLVEVVAAVTLERRARHSMEEMGAMASW